MTALWTGIALLTALAMGFVFWPFLRTGRRPPASADRRHLNIDIFRERLAELEQERDSGTLDAEAYTALKLELERNLLEDAADAPVVEAPLQPGSGRTPATLVTVTLLALLVPAMGLGLYAKYGRSDDLGQALAMQQNPSTGHPATLEEALSQLEAELEARPDNAEGWYLLSSSYMSMGRYTEGAAGFRKVLALLPEDAEQYGGVMGQLAQALFFANGGKMSAEVRQQIERTLAREPNEITALGLLGIDAFEQGRYRAAIDYWLKALDNAESEAAQSLRAGIDKAVQALQAAGQPVPEPAALQPAQIRVKVSLSEALQARVQADQRVFVFARPVGGRMPLAAVRLRVSELPQQIVLDDSQAMTAQARLSSAEEVEVTAKVSLTGQPEASSGDLYGTVAPIRVRGEGKIVELVIDQVVE